MAINEETINALRLALLATPDNIPLQKHLAELLVGAGRFEEAEQVYRAALAQSPDGKAPLVEAAIKERVKALTDRFPIYQ